MVVKTAPVYIYIDGELIGFGELVYNDLSYASLLPTTIHHCDETPVYVDNEVVPLRFCWDDVVAKWFGGTLKKRLAVPVYVDDVKVGEATVELVDSYSADLVSVLLVVALIWLSVDLITRSATGTKEVRLVEHTHRQVKAT
jgi:hypothetical protein